MNRFLSLTNIQKVLVDEKTKEIEILKDINLEIAENEIVSIVGNGGSGKSTLLNLIAGIEKQSTGNITLRGREVEGPCQERSVIFQNHTFLPWLNSYENIEMVLKKVMPELEPQERKERVEHFLQMGELMEVKDLLPSKLSMEMKKRLAIARALSIHPDILLMDNPFSMLQTQTRYALQNYLLKIQRHTKCTIILTTGNVEEALYLGNRVIMMEKNTPKSIAQILNVEIPYPRDRVSLQTNPTYTTAREKLFAFLYAEH